MVRHDGDTQIGLDPDTTYRLDRTLSLPATRFHVTRLPEDFAFWDPNPMLIILLLNKEGEMFQRDSELDSTFMPMSGQPDPGLFWKQI